MRVLILSLLATSLFACSSAKKSTQAVLPKSIDEAVASAYRSPENLPRDQYRHPVETLKFFGLEPGMTVVEISPGSGWYLEILAPLLSGGGGRYIAALPPSAGSEYMTKLNEKVQAWITQHPEVNAEVTSMSGEIAPAGTADMVLTFRNVHNWMTQGTQQEVFNKFFAALKPGGVLGVVEHRASEKGKQDPKAKSGYVKESEVIRLATKAGFKLAAKSEINANPKDTKDHPEGVWTLPPVLRLKEVDRDKYVAIGESDRMTLRFVKPGAASASKVYFIEPKDGAQVTSPFKVRFGLEGMKIGMLGDLQPGLGHHHLIINGQALAKDQVVPTDEKHLHFGKGQTETEVTLPPGDYTLTMQFADGAHRSYGPEMSSTIKVKVVAP